MENNKNFIYAGIAAVALLVILFAIRSEETIAPTDTHDGEESVLEVEGETSELSGTYSSGVLPAASTPGREYTLTLEEDYTATLVADYKTEDRPVVDTGTWEVHDSALSVTFTDRFGFPLEENIQMDFEITEGALSLVDYDKSRWGIMGLTLLRAD